MMGWKGPRWQRVRDNPVPWEDEQVMAEMSSGLGYDSRALIPDFVRATATAAAMKWRETAVIDDRLCSTDPGWVEQVERLKADARARPKRYR